MTSKPFHFNPQHHHHHIIIIITTSECQPNFNPIQSNHHLILISTQIIPLPRIRFPLPQSNIIILKIIINYPLLVNLKPITNLRSIKDYLHLIKPKKKNHNHHNFKKTIKKLRLSSQLLQFMISIIHLHLHPLHLIILILKHTTNLTPRPLPPPTTTTTTIQLSLALLQTITVILLHLNTLIILSLTSRTLIHPLLSLTSTPTLALILYLLITSFNLLVLQLISTHLNPPQTQLHHLLLQTLIHHFHLFQPQPTLSTLDHLILISVLNLPSHRFPLNPPTSPRVPPLTSTLLSPNPLDFHLPHPNPTHNPLLTTLHRHCPRKPLSRHYPGTPRFRIPLSNRLSNLKLPRLSPQQLVPALLPPNSLHPHFSHLGLKPPLSLIRLVPLNLYPPPRPANVKHTKQAHLTKPLVPLPPLINPTVPTLLTWLLARVASWVNTHLVKPWEQVAWVKSN